MIRRTYNFEQPNTPSILVVDDDASIVRLVDHFLETEFESSVKRYHATDALAAQAIIENQLIDIVITDLEMSGPDGFQLLDWLKGWEPLIQVIVITGHDTQDALRSAFALGANDFLVKPLQYASLIQSVGFFLGRLQRWQSLLAKPTPDGQLFGVAPIIRR